MEDFGTAYRDFLLRSHQHSMCFSNTPSSGNGRQGHILMQKLNILHVDPERNWGGGEIQVLGLTTYLNHTGHHSVVAIDPRGILSQRLAQADLSTSVLTVRNDIDIFAGLRLRRLVQTGNYQIVHFHTARAHALSPWLRGLRAKRVVTR